MRLSGDYPVSIAVDESHVSVPEIGTVRMRWGCYLIWCGQAVVQGCHGIRRRRTAGEVNPGGAGGCGQSCGKAGMSQIGVQVAVRICDH